MERITRRDHSKKFQIATTAVHQYELREFKGWTLEVPGLCFHTDSPMLMPDLAVPADVAAAAAAAGTLVPDGLSLIMTALHYAQGNAAHKAWITGHKGAAGEATETSAERASTVYSVLAGDKDAWSALGATKGTAKDIQRILTWVARVWAYACDPEGIDGDIGANTRTAITNFKKLYNVEFSQALPEDATVDAALWGGFFDVYQEVLAVYLGLPDVGGLSGPRGAVKWIDDAKKWVGCGGNHGIDQVRRDGAFRGGERVEVCFFPPGDEPLRDCHPEQTRCKPGKCEAYNPVMFRWTVIPPEPRSMLPKFKLKLELGEIDKIFPDILANNADDPGVRQRLQAVGGLYERLNSPTIQALAREAWTHFKTENDCADDAAGVAKLKDLVKTVVVDQGALPAKGQFAKLRVPGTWCVIDYSPFGNSAGGARYREEKRVWDQNDALGRVPVRAKVEVMRKGWKAAGGQKVQFQLAKPDDIPAGNAVAAEALRATTTNSTSTDNSTAPPTVYNWAMTGSPKKYVDDRRALDAVVADDPQVDNVHKNRGGKRGNATVGATRSSNVLEITNVRASFHTALDLKAAKASAHPNAVVAQTNGKGEAVAILMPAWTGGDRYRIQAWLDPLRGAASTFDAADAVKDETGTLVVWRILRVSNYYRWDYPAAATVAQQNRCGKVLDAFDWAGVISTEFKKDWFDVTLEKKAAARHDFTQAEWAAAMQYAIGRVNPGTSQRYDLPTLLPVADASQSNDNPGLMRFLTAAAYDAAPKTAPAPPGGWPSAVGDAAYWNNMATVFHAVKDEFLHFFTRNAIGGMTVVQCPTMASFHADGVPGAPGTPFRNSGWGTRYRGCYVTFGHDIYTNFPYDHTRNCMHEVGHVLFGPHQYTTQAQVNSNTGGVFDGHDYKDLCIMGYMPCSGGFCGRCVLAHAGWDTSTLPANNPGP